MSNDSGYSKYEKKDFNEKYNLHLMSDIYLSVLLEKFLFDDKPLEDSEFYKKLLEFLILSLMVSSFSPIVFFCIVYKT